MTMFYYRLPSLGLGWNSVTVQNVPACPAHFTVAL